MKKSLTLLTLMFIYFTGLSYDRNDTIIKSLAKIDIRSRNIPTTPITGIRSVSINNYVVYVAENGKHIIHRYMYNVSNTPQSVANTNQLLMKKLKTLEKEMIIYKADEEKHVITVFTDINCGYCRKLYEQIKNYNMLGITVRYLAFPHLGVQSKIEQDMKSIWCAKDRNKAFDDAMKNKSVEPASCDINIANHYALGIRFGVTGTPAIVLSNGYVMLGYQDPNDMKEFLDAHQKQIGSR